MQKQSIIYLAFIAVLLSACGENGCGAGSKSVKLAQSLSQERLAKLHDDMSALRAKILQSGDDDLTKRRGYQNEDIPLEYRDLNAKKVRPCDFSPNIMLEGCFDHFVYLGFYGIGAEDSVDDSPRIVLYYGENDRKAEVLWRRPPKKEAQVQVRSATE